MADLETRLRALADEAAWPPTPDLAGNVATALAAPRGRRGRAAAAPAHGAPAPAGRPTPRRSRRPAPAHAPPGAGRGGGRARAGPRRGRRRLPRRADDVLEWLGLRHTEVQPHAHAAAARAGAHRARPGPPHDAGRGGAPGRLRPLLPAGLGAPDAVRVARLGAATRVTLVYRPRTALPALRGARAGLLVTQVRGSLEGNLLRKVAGPGTDIRRVRVDGHDGLVFSGAPHVYLYLDPAGQILEDRPWLAGNTLVLERDDAVIRLEAAAPPSALERLATTLRVSRPAP